MGTKKDRLEAAEGIRRLLDLVEQGEIEADSPQARRLLRRLEGAQAALEADQVGKSGAAEG